MPKKPKVYLVGCGPGDKNLLTIKALKIIKKAEVVVYDQLIGNEIMKLIPKNAEKINAGKFGSKHTLEQNEINNLLIAKAKEGKIVIRLKGGDPYLFGRGGEEAEELVKSDIDVEVIPGISSAIAVPMYAKIPITHRNFASSLTVITGHEGKHKEKEILDWKLLARLKGTLVILMGVSSLEKNVERLLKNGKSKDTPIAIIEKGTTKHQRTTIGNLGNIIKIAKKRKVKPPAVIVIGDVVKMAKVLKC